MKAWHFTNEKLKNGDPLPEVGEKLVHKGDLLCRSGLHASKRLIDALFYASGPILCRVECGEDIIQHTDKLICSERTILWKLDTTEILKEFARLCALDVVHLWDAPAVVVKYLKTGDEELRNEARCAAVAAEVETTAAIEARAAVWDASMAADRATGTIKDEHGDKQNKRLTRMIREARKKNLGG